MTPNQYGGVLARREVYTHTKKTHTEKETRGLCELAERERASENREGSHPQAEERCIRGHQTCCHLELELLPPRTVRHKYLLSKLPTLCYFARTAPGK